MKRFILCSLSATVALTLGATARADMHSNASEMPETSVDATEGVISPDSQSPNNREIPTDNVESPEMIETENPNRVDGIISPDSQSPNNRTLPDAGVAGNGVDAENPDLIDGIISPDSQSPNNRELPSGATETRDEPMSFQEAFDIYRETGERVEFDRSSAPNRGIISPDSQSPNNRAIPDEGVTGDVMETENPNLTDGVISPDSQSPNNRERVDSEVVPTRQSTSGTDEMNNSTSGVISPDAQSPNNREVVQ
ncbi:hypothetical protein [Halomicronema sp. CCY15110]|uniref:hypothetical protein n=1 Tax=Halomicronema sp. CCY15110 TaxID=2767773 RepID=UPI00194E1C40|nr:hypothetical protein [Halomicronema sp. CCY15110]